MYTNLKLFYILKDKFKGGHMKILFLTKNWNYESSTLSILNNLGHEVLASNSALVAWEKSGHLPNWVNIFTFIVLSETISLSELTELITAINEQNHYCIVKTTAELSDSEKNSIDPDGLVYAFISSATHTFILNDILDYVESKRNFNENKLLLSLEKQEFKIKLSYINKQIYKELNRETNSNKKSVTRETLSKLIWGECTSSTLNQLSLRVKKINKIIEQKLHFTQAIVMVWGSGYKFDDTFYKFVKDKDLRIE